MYLFINMQYYITRNWKLTKTTKQTSFIQYMDLSDFLLKDD